MDIFLEERQIQWMGPKVMLPDDRGMEFQKSAAGSGEPFCEDAIWEKTWRKGEYDLSPSEGRKLRQKKHLVTPGLGRNVLGCPGKAQRSEQQKWSEGDRRQVREVTGANWCRDFAATVRALSSEQGNKLTEDLGETWQDLQVSVYCRIIGDP